MSSIDQISTDLNSTSSIESQSWTPTHTESLTISDEESNSNQPQQTNQDKPIKTKRFSRVRLNIRNMSCMLKKTMLQQKRSTSLEDITKQETRHSSPPWLKTKHYVYVSPLQNSLEALLVSREDQRNRTSSTSSQEFNCTGSSSSSLAIGATAASVAEEEQRRTAETITRNSMSKQKELAAEFDFLVEEQRWLTFVQDLGTKSSRH